MGSSFLTVVNVLLAWYCICSFIRYTFQFGIPNHPARFSLYFVTLCPTAVFTMVSLARLSIVHPVQVVNVWGLPVIAGSFGLLLQVIISVGNFSRLQQKIMSRFPLIGAVISFALFREYASNIFVFCLCAIVLILTVSVGKARYQKRTLFKMCFFFALYLICDQSKIGMISLGGHLFLFPALFYFFVFEQSVGVSSLVDQHFTSSGDST